MDTTLIALGISIISIIFVILNFAVSRNDKTAKETETESYRQGRIDSQLKSIFDKLEKIENKLDNYDNIIEDKIEKSMKAHIEQYHKGE